MGPGRLPTVRRICLLLLACLLAGPPVAASAAQPAAAPQTAPDGFVPVTELPPEEQMPAAPLVVGAYAFIWVAVLAYVAVLWRRMAAIDRELAALKQRSR